MSLRKTAWVLAIGVFPALSTALAAPDTGTGEPLELIWEKPISPFVGAQDLYSSHSVFYMLEDHVLAAGKGKSSRTLGPAKRAARLLLLEFPVDWMHMLIQHEVFGHGYRFIEAGYPDPAFGLHFPFPYGDGHGYATGSYSDRSTTLDEHIAVASGGMEANDVFARTIREKWMASGTMNPQEARLYLLNAFNRSVYAIRARTGMLLSDHGNDIRNYIRFINMRHSGRSLDGRSLDVEDVQLRMLVDALDPFAFYALWTAVGNHLILGRSGFDFPVPEISGTRFLPLAHAGLAPFGVEYYLEALMARKTRTMQVIYRQGDPGAAPFFGLGLAMGNLVELERWTGDLRMELWRQPRLQLGGNVPRSEVTATAPLQSGFGIWTTFRTRPYPGLGFVLEAGYKTRGFVPGEALDEAAIVRAGITFLLPDFPPR